ncbi:ribonuclease Z, partial [uncultured Planktosalinus sp.]|uniref:ribonuclease Z n=1 Tax=uncultured Planktosalinus sp. TaxID=1810935 RepID=UPI0030DAC2F9
VAEFGTFLEYIIPKEFKNDNVVVDLLKYNQLSLPELLNFLIVSNKHRANKKSFVIINEAIDPDVIPEELIVVPTLQEAEDVVELEEIERDLGF